MADKNGTIQSQAPAPETIAPAEIRKAREDLGMSQSALADALGVTPNTLARWERGALRVQQPRMLKLALGALALGTYKDLETLEGAE